MGRIGSAAAVPILLEIIADHDSTVREDALFALGLLGEASTVPRLRDLVINTPASEQGGPHAEAVVAVARIGGSEAADLITELLSRWAGAARGNDPPITVVRALGEAWRLGSDAPVTELSQFSESELRQARLGAIYSLSRLRAPGTSNALIRATEDRDPLIRSLAVRALTAAYADTAALERRGLAARVENLVDDPDPRVRTNALRALATFGGDRHVSAVVDRTGDTDPNVRVQALTTLGALGGEQAAKTLRDHVSGGFLATQRQALLSLARVSPSLASQEIEGWLTSNDWRRRLVAVQALRPVAADTTTGGVDSPRERARTVLLQLLGDPDPRVVALALSSLFPLDPTLKRSLARRFARHKDEVVRAVALEQLIEWADSGDIDLLADAYEMGAADRIPDARIAIVEALGAIAEQDLVSRTMIETKFLARFPTCDNHLVRRAAEEGFAVAADRWGPSRPVDTGRGIADYRDLVREMVLPAERGEYRPSLVIEADRGNIVVELLAADAPLTVQSFLDLVDRRYFDGGLWHRVVPNFVIQAGDPRGDGWGSPGFAIRDEVSRRQFDRGTVGVALSGPDTGGSQFFITHSPQPHLDGVFTIFGQVRTGFEFLDRITWGDRIRRIRRE
jgi:cyclophilin family peptidyl-prolyl cis-trans isomerase/HEAT repeat protein